MSILRRCAAVVFWLIGWLCATEFTDLAVSPITPTRWLPDATGYQAITACIGLAIIFFLVAIAAVIFGEQLWRGDVTKRWSAPRLVRNFFILGCGIVLVACYLKAFILDAEPNDIDIYVPWIPAIFVTAILPLTGLFQSRVKLSI